MDYTILGFDPAFFWTSLIGIIGFLATSFAAWRTHRSAKETKEILGHVRTTADEARQSSVDAQETMEKTIAIADASKKASHSAFNLVKGIDDEMQEHLFDRHKVFENAGEMILYMAHTLNYLKDAPVVYYTNFALRFGAVHTVNPRTEENLRAAYKSLIPKLRRDLPTSELRELWRAHKDNPKQLLDRTISHINGLLENFAGNPHTDFRCVLLSEEKFENSFLPKLHHSSNDWHEDYSELRDDPNVFQRIVEEERHAREKFRTICEKSGECNGITENDVIPLQFVTGKLKDPDSLFSKGSSFLSGSETKSVLESDDSGSLDAEGWCTTTLFIGSETLHGSKDDFGFDVATPDKAAIGVYSRTSRYATSAAHIFGWLHSVKQPEND